MPTYHLANVVDDYLMQITHVIRGEEWLPSAPLHVMLYKYLGLEKEMPAFAHLPLILKPDGNGKLSKRDGDRMGFPVFPINWKDPRSGEIYSGYRESGYLPEAFVNMLAFLGWNPGTEQEIFTMNELISSFDLERIGKSGSKFDPEKAKWFNQEYIKLTENKNLAEIFKDEIISRGHIYDAAYTEKVCSLIKERITLLADFWDTASYFYEAPVDYNKKIIEKKWKENSTEYLIKLAGWFSLLPLFDAQILEKSITQFIEGHHLNTGAVIFPIRFVITGLTGGPSVFEILSLIGKEECLRRIRNFQNFLSHEFHE